MVMMEGWSPTTVSPLLLRNLVASVFIFADKSFLNLSQKSKLLQLLRYLFVTSFIFLLRLLPSLNPNNTQPYHYKPPTFNKSSNHSTTHDHYDYTPASSGSAATITSGGDSAIGRALSQLLSLVNDIPVTSRKYQVVRSLAESLIDDNQKEGVEALRQVTRTVLSAAFSTTLSQLEAVAALEQGDVSGGDGVDLLGPARPAEYRLSWVLRAVRSIGDVTWIRGARASGTRSSAEKLAAEVLWLAEKLAACDSADEAVRRWAAALNLAWLSLSVEPRLQASLVKVSALLFKHAKHLGMDETDDESKKQHKQTKMQMLMSWLPLLCRASNGTDVPVLSIGERAELERVLEETIEMLEEEEDQEKVLSLWLHHFTHCSSSDWPNLHASYARWLDLFYIEPNITLAAKPFRAALLFKQAKLLGMDETDNESKKEQHKQTEVQTSNSWLPLLCRASNGTDVPVLSIGGRAELDRVLEATIEMLEEEKDQEKVLSLWLHHLLKQTEY
ncbi:hypothetical protein ACFX13_002815 [Malus domestica]